MTEEILIRRVLSTKEATTGVLIYQNRPILLTLEDPWLGNQPNISCIPPGKYHCVRHNTVNHANTWRLENVPGRTWILLHSGSTESDTKGCILVGRRFQIINGTTGIVESQLAMDQFRYLTKAWKEFTITIEDVK